MLYLNSDSLIEVEISEVVFKLKPIDGKTEMQFYELLRKIQNAYKLFSSANDSLKFIKNALPQEKIKKYLKVDLSKKDLDTFYTVISDIIPKVEKIEKTEKTEDNVVMHIMSVEVRHFLKSILVGWHSDSVVLPTFEVNNVCDSVLSTNAIMRIFTTYQKCGYGDKEELKN